MPDILDAMSKLSKAHDYFGKSKDLYKNIETIRKAADIDPHDPVQLQKLVGITDKETQKLLKTLNKRVKDTEIAAKAKFPAVKSDTTAKWGDWFVAMSKHGDGSSQEKKARNAYLKALLAYDLLLRERLLDCNIYIKQSAKQVKIYKGLVELHKSVEKICLAVIKAPSTTGTAPQASAMKILLKFQGVKGPAIRIHKAHSKIISNAKTEKLRLEGIKSINDVWISDVQGKNLGDMVKKALSALGV